jgi:leucine-rich repeat protein SHOC2
MADLRKARNLEIALKSPDEIGTLTLFDFEGDQVPATVAELKNLHTLEVWKREPNVQLPDSLAELKNLRNLRIAAPWTEVPALIAQLTGLTALHLDGFKGETIPPSLRALQNLEELTISALNVHDFPEFVTELTSLRALDLSANHFASIPDSLARLTNLEELNLERSYEICGFPRAILALRALRVLKLGSAVGMAPACPELSALTELEELDLRGWHMGELPESFGEWKKLRMLSLAECALTSLPESVGGWTSLRELWLNRNQLTTLPDRIADWAALEDLNLQDNPLTSLPDSIGKLSALRKLDLSGTSLRSLPAAIGELQSLRVLSLNNNPSLAELPSELGDLRGLQNLHATRGGLRSIPPTLGRSKTLSSLWVSHSKVTTFPTELAQCEAMTAFEATGCEFDAQSYRSLVAFEAAQKKRGKFTSFRLPRKGKKRPTYPETASATEPSAAVGKELRRLGIELPPARQPQPHVTLPYGKHPLPDAVDRLTRARWPALHAPNGVASFEFPDIELGVGIDLTEYECIHHRAYYAFGWDRSVGFYFLLDLADKKPENPAVYLLDHSDYALEKPTKLVSSISAFLEAVSLKPASVAPPTQR